MIYYCTPFSIEKNLGRAYNEYVSKLAQHPDDWVFLIDGDCMFLNPNWGNHIKDLVEANKDAGILTCYVNRVGNKQQCLDGVRNNNPDILDHYYISQSLKENYWSTKEINRVISGCMFGFSRKTWEEVGGFTENQEILKVDNRFSKKVLQLGKKILLMEGVYAFHLYRLHEPDPKHAKQHLL